MIAQLLSLTAKPPSRRHLIFILCVRVIMIMWQNYFVNSVGHAGTWPRRGRPLHNLAQNIRARPMIRANRIMVSLLCWKRDLFGKPVPTLPDHALIWQRQLEELHPLRPQNRSRRSLSLVKKFVLIFLLLILMPVGVSTANYLAGDRRGNWQMADRSSAGLLPQASEHPDALVRVFAARTVRWRGIFAVHTWIVVKERGGSRYSRYDYTAWGEPIRIDGFVPDGRWFGARPETVAGVDGDEAQKLIPKIRNAIESYKFRAYGDYSAWPGPNSNTFVQAVLDAVPELSAVLPPTAIGKDYPYRGAWCGLTSSGTGLFISFGGYLGLTIGWVEGVELNFLGGVLGLDIRRPAIKLPGIGRLGIPPDTVK